MVLVDTAVWVAHFRAANRALEDLLFNEQVFMHTLVVGELACGNLRNRAEVLKLLQELPVAQIAQASEVLSFIEDRRLWGKGIGWIDAHLLASAVLTGCQLWTIDQRLSTAAKSLKINYPISTERM